MNIRGATNLGLKSNVTHQLLAYTDDVNLLGDNLDTIRKNTATLIDAREEIGLEMNECYLVIRM
jgi:hypothetical protein